MGAVEWDEMRIEVDPLQMKVTKLVEIWNVLRPVPCVCVVNNPALLGNATTSRVPGCIEVADT